MMTVSVQLSAPSPAGVLDVAAAVALALQADNPLPAGTVVHEIAVTEDDA